MVHLRWWLSQCSANETSSIFIRFNVKINAHESFFDENSYHSFILQWKEKVAFNLIVPSPGVYLQLIQVVLRSESITRWHLLLLKRLERIERKFSKKNEKKSAKKEKLKFCWLKKIDVARNGDRGTKKFKSLSVKTEVSKLFVALWLWSFFDIGIRSVKKVTWLDLDVLVCVWRN